MDHLYAGLELAAALAVLFGSVLTLVAWAGKCPKCKSLRNWERGHELTDSYYSECSACGHTKSLFR